MELDSLLTSDAHNEGAEIQIIAPDGKETDVYIKVLGVDSDEFQRAMRKARTNAFSRKESNEDDIIQEEIAQLVAVTIGWRGLTSNGDELKFSSKECANLYAKAPYIRNQIDRFILDRTNFMKG